MLAQLVPAIKEKILDAADRLNILDDLFAMVCCYIFLSVIVNIYACCSLKTVRIGASFAVILQRKLACERFSKGFNCYPLLHFTSKYLMHCIKCFQDGAYLRIAVDSRS